MIITTAYYTMCKYFIDFRPPIRFICERSDENETYNSVTVSVSVRFRFGFGAYVKRPLGFCNRSKPYELHKFD